MSKRNLLLCFDAFGTLFWPKLTIAQQYGQIARQCGMTGWTEAELASQLRTAIKDETVQHPNFGKATGLGATRWWTNVIHKTFQPFARDHQPLPADLAPRLLHRFSSSHGYDAEQGLVASLKRLKQTKFNPVFDDIIIGVITNSDDRVPSVLSSFGLSVSPLRYGCSKPSYPRREPYDIDFHCISYDVGYEKPHVAIFHSAEALLAGLVANGATPPKLDHGSWHKLYVGDEYAKDVVGALDAGWNPVLLDRDGEATEITRLQDLSNISIGDVFQRHEVVRVGSIRDVTRWLLRQRPSQRE